MYGVSPESSCTTKHTKSTKREAPFSLAAVFSGLFFFRLFVAFVIFVVQQNSLTALARMSSIAS